MSEFILGLAWGAGLSLGLCVGMVAWVVLREGAYWLTGASARYIGVDEVNRRSLAALQERNRLTVIAIDTLDRIAVTLERMEESNRE